MTTSDRQKESSANGPDFLTVGKFRRTHGIRGDLLFTVITDFPERLRPGTSVFVGVDRAEMKISRSKPHNDGIIFGFKGLTNPEDAKKYVGADVFVHAADRPELPEGEYYHHQIIGLKVVDEVLGELGLISEVLETGANDVYVVLNADKKEILVPALKSVLKQVDLSAGIMTVALPEGLV